MNIITLVKYGCCRESQAPLIELLEKYDFKVAKPVQNFNAVIISLRNAEIARGWLRLAKTAPSLLPIYFLILST
jgi:hypothetical protein